MVNVRVRRVLFLERGLSVLEEGVKTRGGLWERGCSSAGAGVHWKGKVSLTSCSGVPLAWGLVRYCRR